MVKEKYYNALHKCAKVWAKKSSCLKRKVGAIITYDGTMLITGHNGTGRRAPHDCCEYVEFTCGRCNKKEEIAIQKHGKILESSSYKCKHCNAVSTYPAGTSFNNCFKLMTHDYTVHAEQSAINNAKKAGVSLAGWTMFITVSPCMDCAVAIANAGIKKITYKSMYKDSKPLHYLHGKNVECELIRY